MNKPLLSFILLLFAWNGLTAATCLPEWKFRRPITVTNTNAASYTDFQVKLVLNTQALIAAGKMKINGDDIRFTDANCNNLHYWIDSNMNTTTTVIWIKMGNIPASGSSTINLYYGNHCATAVQNGDSTFVLFDDFTGSSLNTAKWNTYQSNPGSSSTTLSGGQVTISTSVNDNIIRSVNTYASPLRLESKVTALSGTYPNIAILNSGTFNGASLFSAAGPLFHTSSATPSCLSYAVTGNSSGIASAVGVWGLSWNGTSAVSVFPGGTQTFTTAASVAASVHASMGMLCASIGSITMDWTRLRKFAPAEPSLTAGAETTQGLQVTFTPTTICPGAPLTINVSKSGVYFGSGNIFTVQLSDASGNFGSPFNLGTVTDTVLSSVTFEIPKLTPPGSGYKIRITSSNPALNCFSSISTLTVKPKPSVSYTIDTDNQCFKWNKYQFTSTSSISSGTLDTFIWKWDDLSKSDTITGSSISHSFKTFYWYFYPKLTVISNLGCRDSASIQVNVRETPVIKTYFNDTIQCFRGNFFIIKSLTTTDSGSITFKSFNYGDGSPTITNVDSLTHSYASPGIYQVRQINQHSNGCRDTSDLGSLVNTHPNAIINTNDTDQCLNGNAFEFEAKSTITNGLPLLNHWDIGDSQIRDLQDSVHYSYPNAGNRTVTLVTISDDGVDGCADTATQLILVNPMPKAVVNNLDIAECFNYNSFRFRAKSSISSGSLSHNWNFGDGNTASALDSTAHSYTTDGAFTVKLYAVSNKGCVDSTSTLVNVRPSPVTSFTLNRDTQCFKYNELKAQSTSSISSGTYTKFWQLSDGNYFTDVDSIAHKFGSYGSYQISLELTSNFGCKDTATDSVHILTMPVSSFSANDEDQCLIGNSYTFTDNSSYAFGNITGNMWIFGDGLTDANKSSVVHAYAADNAYVPALIVYADNGCFDTSFLNVKVYPHPGSDFLINDAGQCVTDNNFIFTNNTFIAEGGFTNRYYFGDGSPFVTGFNATKKYNKDSTYLVTLISISDQGCTDTADKTITVFPKANTAFTINQAQQCLLGNSFTFTSGTTLKSGSYTLRWLAGDGFTAGNVPSMQHTYTGVQQYTVRLISTTNENCLDTVARTIRTLPMPVAGFTFNYGQSCLKDNDFQFNSSSTVSSGTPMSHNWYFGDNDSTINSTFAQHSYKTDGTFKVRMISSTNIGGCKDTAERDFNVFPMPVASFTIDDNEQCFENNSFAFNSTSAVSSGSIDIHDWSFGDNTTSAVSNPVKTYAGVNTYIVILNVSTDRSCTDADTQTVSVFPMPVADFTVTPDKSCLRGNAFTIANKSSIGSGGVISEYKFYYGNGDSSMLRNPAPYSYTAAGDYVILLNTTTDKGCTDTLSRMITVNPNPNLAFSVAAVCLKDSSVFINNTTDPDSIASWKWLFGNGRISTLKDPKFKYKNVGAYDITLIAATNKGCIDTLFKPGEAVVNPNPKAGFYFIKKNSDVNFNEVEVNYMDTSSGAVEWRWNFSSMGTSTEQNPKLYYTDTLTQRTSLIVKNTFGCSDTVVKTLFIAPDVIYFMPSAFTPNDDNINETFKPIGLYYTINYKFIIFNRWGEILFKTENPQQGWDGTYNGEKVPQDLYFYRIEFIGLDELRHEEKGNVMILK